MLSMNAARAPHTDPPAPVKPNAGESAGAAIERANKESRKPQIAPLPAATAALALDRMTGGQFADLIVVRQYLDAEQGGEA